MPKREQPQPERDCLNWCLSCTTSNLSQWKWKCIEDDLGHPPMWFATQPTICHDHVHQSPPPLNQTFRVPSQTYPVQFLQFRPHTMMSFVSILMSCAPIPLLFLILYRYLPLAACLHWPHLFTWTLHLSIFIPLVSLILRSSVWESTRDSVPPLFSYSHHCPIRLQWSSHLLGTLASCFHPLDIPVGSGADHMPQLSHSLWPPKTPFSLWFGVWSRAGYMTLTPSLLVNLWRIWANMLPPTKLTSLYAFPWMRWL